MCTTTFSCVSQTFFFPEKGVKTVPSGIRTLVVLLHFACQAEDASLRRKRRIEALKKEIEISEASIEIDRELVIGSGGSGEVFLANYDGINAACKVQGVR